MSKARELAELGAVYDSGALSNRNIIINGAMQVAQRGTSIASISSGSPYLLDRWQINSANSSGAFGTWTATQDSDAPSGFGSSLKMDCTATSTLASLTFLRVQQRIEGQNLQQLKKGTANAEPVTLSFWVKSAKTGIHSAELFDTANDRNFSQQYTVNASGAWEYKTITYEGDITGSLANDNSGAFYVAFWLLAGTTYDTGTQSTGWAAASNRATGQVDLGDSTSNYWQITGVQLEVGTEATPFEHRSYGDELLRCQRYFVKYTSANVNTSIANGLSQTSSTGTFTLRFNPELRSSPSIAISGLGMTDHTNYTSVVTSSHYSTSSNNSLRFGLTGNAVMSTYRPASAVIQTANGYLTFDSEL